jgi:hypothetical protein
MTDPAAAAARSAAAILAPDLGLNLPAEVEAVLVSAPRSARIAIWIRSRWPA